MKIVFIQNYFFEWQAPMLFSAILRKEGHTTELIFEPIPSVAAKKALSLHPDLIVFHSIITGNQQFYIKCAEEIKRIWDVTILAGGPHVMLYPELLIDSHIDVLGYCHGEKTIIELVNAIQYRSTFDEVCGIIYKKGSSLITTPRPEPVILDELPTIDREIYYKHSVFRNEKVRLFYGSRGCSNKCSFCCTPRINPTVEFRSPKKIIEEIKEVRDKYGMKAAFFQDSCFTKNKLWLEELLNYYKKELDNPLFCMVRAKDIDERTAKMLGDARCKRVGISIETGNEEIRAGLFNMQEKNEEIISSISYLRENGIKVTSFNMFGFPTDSVETAKMTINLNRKAKVHSPWGLTYKPYPRTPLYDQIEKTGLDIVGSVMECNPSIYAGIKLDIKDKEELENTSRLLNLIVKFPFLEDSKLLKSKRFGKLFYFYFCFYSYMREIFFWKRSPILYLYIGIKNMLGSAYGNN